MVFSGHKTEANHGQGMGVTSGEAGTLGGKTERQKQAASEAFKVCVCVCVGVCTCMLEGVVQRTQETERTKQEGHREIWERERPCFRTTVSQRQN